MRWAFSIGFLLAALACAWRGYLALPELLYVSAMFVMAIVFGLGAYMAFVRPEAVSEFFAGPRIARLTPIVLAVALVAIGTAVFLLTPN